MVKDEYFSLLKEWCDGLLKHQLLMPGRKRFDGALLCPACTVIHGRCHDAVYPLLYMADATGEAQYKDAALRLFDWGENMVCDDGSFYNDAQSEWNGITVFGVIGLYDSLKHHGHLLDEGTHTRFEERMKRGAWWIYRTITPEFVTNINYHATASAALSLAGGYFEIEAFRERAGQLAGLCVNHITADGFLYGEGQPREAFTKRNCRPVDIGYNVEESAPALLLYARSSGDEEILQKVKALLKNQLDFMMPDGGWDNSFGSRNFKWTYWGSRTSDGCQLAYGTWGSQEPLFAEAARRNLKQYRSCTHDGLLYGGPGYRDHGEEPCIHHTFCHAKALAAVLDYGIEETMRQELPAELGSGVTHYPTIDTYKIKAGGFLAALTGYDFEYMKGGHASGGCVTMLWHRETGPILAASMTRYWLKEAHNMQLTKKKAEHQPLLMGVELRENGKVYSQVFDYESQIHVYEGEGVVKGEVQAFLVDENQFFPSEKTSCHLCYTWSENQFIVEGQVGGDALCRAALIFPVIGRHKDGCRIERKSQEDGRFEWKAVVKRERCGIAIHSSCECEAAEPIFFLAGGFEAWKFAVRPDQNGKFCVKLEIEKGP